MIKPICCKCNEELKQFGAIVLSPPLEFGNEQEVIKYHVCFSTVGSI
jgi:hypothetical protein